MELDRKSIEVLKEEEDITLGILRYFDITIATRGGFDGVKSTISDGSKISPRKVFDKVKDLTDSLLMKKLGTIIEGFEVIKIPFTCVVGYKASNKTDGIKINFRHILSSDDYFLHFNKMIEIIRGLYPKYIVKGNIVIPYDC